MNKRHKKLLDQVRDAIRVKHYSIRTEQAYVGWIRRYILFHHKQHPRNMGVPEIEAFLTHLAVEQNVAASTQNQAFSALLFLYRHVLKQDLEGPIESVRAKKPKRLPTVLTKDQVLRLIGFLTGAYQLMAKLLYGSGLRLSECRQLRVKDVDFDRQQIIVRDAKGKKDRATLLPNTIIPFLREHLRHVKWTHDDDLSKGYGSVYLPFALRRKYPHASRE